MKNLHNRLSGIRKQKPNLRSTKSTLSTRLVAFIALGSNLGKPRETVLQAMDHLQKLSDEPVMKSSLWSTSPVDCPPGSPSFVNAVVGLAPRRGETPDSLLKQLLKLEKNFGRLPKRIINEPRTLDLDLIAFGSETRQTKRLTLPHPRAHLRTFVLQPLSQLAPDLVLPGQRKSVQELLDALPADKKMRRTR
jgi:2-amino-4-hydroxy-6-hydroxymethyldihydropteridine diphosphokinase